MGTHTVAVARCHGSVHDGLIRGFNGKDALEVWVQMGEEGHYGGPSKRTTVVILSLAF